MLLRSNFSSFPNYFYMYIFLTSGVKLHIHLLIVVVQFIVYITLSTLICRGTDISKCFSESFGIRDNDIRLYSNTPVKRQMYSDGEPVREAGWGENWEGGRKSVTLASVLLNTEKNIFYWKGPNKRLSGIKKDVYVKYQSVLEVHRI